MKFSRDNSIKGLQCRRRKNINRKIILKQSRMQCLIREVHVKCQESSVEKNYTGNLYYFKEIMKSDIKM